MSPEPAIHGTVLEFDPQRGYGRIRDEKDVAYFVHFRDLIDTDTLEAGQSVRFLPVLHRKGNIAQQVQLT